MEVGGLTDRDHEVLGVEYCSGYTDSFGKWNTGFYCPTMGERVYCCGTQSHKYCCTKRDQERASWTDQTFLLLAALGSVLVAVCLVLFLCSLWRRFLGHRKRHLPTNGGPLYRLHCSSTASGVANMYSFSGENSSAATPMEGPVVDLPVFSPEQRSRGLFSEPPPPYPSDTISGPTSSFSSRGTYHVCGSTEL